MKKGYKLVTVMLYIFTIGIVVSFFTIRHISQKIAPSVTKYAISEVKRLSTLVINDSINKDIANMNLDNIFNIERNNANEVVTIDLNTKVINKLLTSVNKTIQTNLKKVENGQISDLDDYFEDFSDIDYEEIQDGIIYYIEAGTFTGDFLLNNIGPKIPIKFKTTGHVISEVNSNVKEYGINNAMIEVKIQVSVTMIINMPFVSKEVNVNTEVPIIMKIIQGTIPEYYLGNNLNNN